MTNAAGCDSVVTLDLIINNSTTGTDVITACGSYTWIDGNTYTASNNTATYTLINAAGCDSVVTLDLTIYYNTSGPDVITACDSYTWIDGITYTASNNTATSTVSSPNGCESIITLDLTITHSNTGTDVVTACDSYTWIDGNTYTESSNTATYTLTNVAGCDSVVTLDLTINTVDVSVIENGITLTANLAGASYQWIDCNDNNNPIAGETNQSYTATADGSYAVIVDDGNCSDTSICYAVIGVDAKLIKEAAVNIYPNPTNGIVFIQGEGIKSIMVTDVNGRIVKQVITTQQQVTLDLTGNVQGLYFVNIETKKGRIIRKILLK